MKKTLLLLVTCLSLTIVGNAQTKRTARPVKKSQAIHPTLIGNKVMIKLFAITILLLTGLTASAQGTWKTVKVEADELKGVKGGESYQYSVDSIGYIEIIDWKKDRIIITTNVGKFEYSKHEVENPVTRMNKVVYISKVLIGLYNVEGALQEKIDGESYFDEEGESKSLFVVGRTFTQTRQMKRILKAVQSGKGCLRIVCKRKDMPDFDIKTTPYQ